MRKEDLYMFIVFFVSWLIFSGDLSISSLILGLVLSAALILLIRKKDKNWTVKVLMIRGAYIFFYLAYLLMEAFISSCQVAYLVLHPKLPLKPAIVKVQSDFDYKNKLMSMTLLANSITLTPGTLTVDIDPEDQTYYIHWIDMKELEGDDLKSEIFGSFEEIIRRIFK